MRGCGLIGGSVSLMVCLGVSKAHARSSPSLPSSLLFLSLQIRITSPTTSLSYFSNIMPAIPAAIYLP